MTVKIDVGDGCDGGGGDVDGGGLIKRSASCMVRPLWRAMEQMELWSTPGYLHSYMPTLLSVMGCLWMDGWNVIIRAI